MLVVPLTDNIACRSHRRPSPALLASDLMRRVRSLESGVRRQGASREGCPWRSDGRQCAGRRGPTGGSAREKVRRETVRGRAPTGGSAQEEEVRREVVREKKRSMSVESEVPRATFRESRGKTSEFICPLYIWIKIWKIFKS